MNFNLQSDALSFREDSFRRMVEQCCGKVVLELLQLQLIDTSLDLIEVTDPLSILQVESDRTASMKEALGIPCTDDRGSYSFFVMPGVRLKLDKLIRSLRALIPPNVASSSSPSKPLTISSALVRQYPFLVDLVFCLESNLLTDFSIKFLSTWMFNLARTCKSSFRYPTSVKEFSNALYILAGPNAFEFVRLNIPGSIPSLTSVRSMLSSSEYQLAEGEFQYSRFQELIRPLDCKYAVCGEDCTSVVPKVSYNKRTNSFVGFTLPLQDGFPRCQFYSTNSLEELESWHQAAQKSCLLNIHVLQGLTSQSQTPISPFLLAAYGTNGKYCAPDVLSRWSRSFDVMMAKGVRILGFSTDCDAKNLRAMRDAMAFFTRNDNPFLKHPHLFTISSLQVNKAKILIEERKININIHFFVFTLATDLR